ncbi:MAG: gamma carbonic anhydrase family protein [Sporomusaceae bacterium]|nr:gamma carbonic anhydrase family protein [Sporomusaceae bacterium]
MSKSYTGDSFEGISPTLHEKTFIAEGARVLGAVTLREYASVWFNTVARGDVNSIEVGRYSNVQDNSVLHVADDNPCIIGDYVTVGHNAILHGCVVEEHCLIGMGAIVLTGAVVGKGSIIAAGAVVRENQVIPPHSLVAGVPAKVIKPIPDEWDRIHAQALKYKTLWTERYKLLPDADGERYHGEKIV